jgi:hypothetical protein
VKKIYRIFTLIFSLAITLMLFSTNAIAYDRTAAKTYADKYALSYNSAYTKFTDDCTNYVSQALHAGGIAQKVYYVSGAPFSTSDDHYWFWNTSTKAHSYSWTVAKDLWTYLLSYSSHGDIAGTYDGDIGNNKYNPLLSGDLVAYNWGEHDLGKANHWAMEITYGTDPDSGWTGDLVDAHSTNHKHAYWTLQPYNAKAYKTIVWAVSIN